MTSRIIDCFEIKDHVALEYGAAGVVVLIESKSGPPPMSGEKIMIIRSDGWWYAGIAEDVRPGHNKASGGFFLRGLTKEDVPLDSDVRWGKTLPNISDAVA